MAFVTNFVTRVNFDPGLISVPNSKENHIKIFTSLRLAVRGVGFLRCGWMGTGKELNPGRSLTL
jgi:hypothetical protein